MNFDAKERTVLLVKHGSHAYGLNTPESDIDYRGICIEPIEFVISAVNNFEQSILNKIDNNDCDYTIFGLRKFINLSLDSNPNAIEILFVDENERVFCDEFGKKLLDNRDLFLSKRIYHTFGGYAKAQLKRLENHRRWIVNPPSAPPTRKDFGLLDKAQFSEDQKKAAFSMISKKLDKWNFKDLSDDDRASRIDLINSTTETISEILDNANKTIEDVAAKSLGFSDNFIDYITKEKRYEQLVQEWKNYQNWQQTRNKKRYETEIKCLCDTKHASHLIRLLLQAIDALNGKGLILKRDKEDRELLLAIKQGKFGKETYNEVIKLKEELDQKLDQAIKETTIRARPEIQKIDSIVRELYLEYWNNENRKRT